MMKKLTLSLIVMTGLMLMMIGGVSAATINVPGNYSTIQAAIDAASAGDTVNVTAGTYDEQVVIDKSLTLQGAGDTTIIQPSGAGVLTTVKTTPWIGGGNRKMAAIVFIDTANEVTVKNLKIDGSLITTLPSGISGDDWVAGLAYLETSGTIDAVIVIGNPNLDCRAAGIFASAITNTANVEVTGCSVIGYNRAGIYALGGTMIADYNNNEINGPGISYTGNQVPNGMFFLEGAKGSATYNTVTDLSYTGEEYRSTGIGTYNADVDVVFSHNEISNVQNAFALSTDTIGTIVEYNDIHDCHTGVRIEARAVNSIIRYNEIYNNDFAMRCGAEMGDGNVANYNNFVNNPGTLWTNVEKGVTYNYVGAVSNVHDTYVLNAENNWWGDNSGPYHATTNPSGSGDSVSDNVDYDPWLGAEVGTSPMTWYTNDNIQSAIDSANPGDTINVAAGTYAGAVVNKSVKIIGAADGTSVITSGVPYKAGNSALTSAFRPEVDGAEIRNFDIANEIDLGIYAIEVNDITIDSITIGDTIQGISNWGGSYWTITNNVIESTVASSGGGIGIFLGAKAQQQCVGNLVQYNEINAMATAETYSTPGIAVTLDTRYGGYDLLNGTEDVSGNQILDNIIMASGANNGVGIEVGTILGNSETDPDRTNSTKIAALMEAAAVNDNLVEGNTIDGAETGVYFYIVTDLTVTQNEIKNIIDNGVYVEHAHNGTSVNHNILSSLTNDADTEVNAENNWWGTNDGEVIATMISGNVDYDPWTTQGQDTVITTPDVPEVVDTTGTDTEMTITTSTAQTGTVTVQQSSANPEADTGLITIEGLDVYLEITTDIPEGEITEIVIRIYYDPADLGGKSELSLKPYWWNLSSEAWEVIIDYDVNTEDNYVYFTVTHLSLFTLGGSEGNVGGPGGDFIGLSVPDFIDYGTLYGIPGFESAEQTIHLDNTGSINIKVTPKWISGDDVFKYIKFSDTSGETFDMIQDGIGTESIYNTTINAVDAEPPFENPKDVYSKIVLTDDLRPLVGPQLGTIFFNVEGIFVP